MLFTVFATDYTKAIYLSLKVNHQLLALKGATLNFLGGGGSCSLDPLIFLDFIPCSPLIKPLVPKNVFSSCSLYPENFCAVPLIPKNVYHCSPYLFASFTFLFIVKKSPYLQINLAQVQSSISPWVFPAHCGILLQ